MTDPMILAERLKTADSLIHATVCLTSLEKALPTCTTAQERRRLRKAISTFQANARRHGERLLQLAISDSAARVA